MNDDLRGRLDAWLARLNGPGCQGIEDRNRAVAEMRETGADRLFPLLAPRLADPDAEVRCAICEVLLRLDAGRGVALVMPLLDDPDSTVRWYASGCLHDFGDERVVDALIRVLRNDPDAQVRGTAAYALGGIGSPAAIPALLDALESDHELDVLGHSASSSAATALDDILGTDETRLKVSGSLCRMREGEPDLVRLRRLAEELYQRWVAGREGKRP
jgi:HEAT repeat protein